jgi:hypothetical protein
MNIIDKGGGPLVSRYKAERSQMSRRRGWRLSFTSKVTTTGCAGARP